MQLNPKVTELYKMLMQICKYVLVLFDVMKYVQKNTIVRKKKYAFALYIILLELLCNFALV